MESRKIVLMNPFTGKKWRGRLRDWTCGHCRGGEGGRNGESSLDKYTLACVKQVAGGELLCATGKPSLALCDDPERRGGRRGGRLQREELYVVCTGMTAETNTTL